MIIFRVNGWRFVIGRELFNRFYIAIVQRMIGSIYMCIEIHEVCV